MSSSTFVFLGSGLSLVILIWLGVLTYYLVLQNRFFAELTKGVSKHDLKTILKNIAASLKSVGTELNDIDEVISEMKKRDLDHFQKIGFIRYNPFSDTGGDQSFCLCILNDQNSGVLLTSLHSREQTRIYAKQIHKGACEGSTMSKEEEEALIQAVGKKKKT
jgi:hypothetical protein